MPYILGCIFPRDIYHLLSSMWGEAKNPSKKQLLRLREAEQNILQPDRAGEGKKGEFKDTKWAGTKEAMLVERKEAQRNQPNKFEPFSL